MNKSELIAEVATKAEITKKDADAAISEEGGQGPAGGLWHL